MYKSFSTFQDILEYQKIDKEWEGAEAALRNRYPIRFVLFEDFGDFYEFIEELPGSIYKFPINYLIDKEYPDIFPTFTTLSKTIKDTVKGLVCNDAVIFPFSEMGRFYTHREFLSLIKTIRGYEPPEDAQMNHVRFYIPIVGMQGKMGPFMDDHQTFIWEYKSPKERETYNLILTNDTLYGITGLEKEYSVVTNLNEWLKLWERGKDVKKNIICTSRNIFANAHNAQPDNAFVYIECDNVYSFLTHGLHLDFGNIEPSKEDLFQWEQLASLIDIEEFDFHRFIHERFDIYTIENSNDFINTWFECEDDFDRWLLAMYYRTICEGKGYICEVLSKCTTLSTSELFSKIATYIFDVSQSEESIRERRQALSIASRQGVQITEEAEKLVYAKLSAMMSGGPEARYTGIKLMTSLTNSERRFTVEQFGRHKINRTDIEKIYPELYHYTSPFGIQLPPINQWINKYFEAYRESKLENNNEKIKPILSEKNGKQSTFQGWYENLKTVKTILHDREDIDIYYWIDGLGVDWIPFISYVIQKFNMDKVYLNEIHIARALLPTTTSINKPQIESLLPSGIKLEKIGDLDSYAHQNSKYPQYIIDELQLIETCISKILAQYSGKKICFISDHGLTYMAQYGKGLNFAGLTTNHDGRTGEFKEKAISDSQYCILEDGKTVCSLTDDSLSTKTPIGHGAHGGATPEEILVPIIIVSNHPNASTYSSELITSEVSGTNPVIKMVIKGLSSIDIPLVEYNGLTYGMHAISSNTFESDKLNLVDTASTVTLLIGESYKKTFHFKTSTGAIEEDLFGDII